MSDSENLERIGHAMMLAWGRIKKTQTRMWGDWMTIGEGLLEGRRWAMQKAGIASKNLPQGKGYVMAYSEWLTRWKVNDMDNSDRAKLLQLMEERAAVEEWRATLTDHERRNLNNPIIVWRKWTAATRVKKPKPRTAGVSASEHGRAKATVEQLQARVSELEEELEATPRRTRERTLDDWFTFFSLEIHDAAMTLSTDEKKELLDQIMQMVEELKEEDDAPDPEQGLQWSGNDDDGWLGRGKHAAYTVIDIRVGAVTHVEARVISPDADFTLPVEQLAEQYGTPLTREVKGKIVPLDLRITAAEAKESCEIAYGQQ